MATTLSAGANVANCSHNAGTGVRKRLLALFVEDVDLNAQENDIAFAIADGGPGVGLVRKPT